MYRIGEEEIEEVARVIRSGHMFRMGEGVPGHLREVDRFEEAWSEKIGVAHTLCVTSGTAALTCGLVGLGIGPGDEVIVPGYTFMATAIAVLSVGAIPVIAEVDDSLTLDPNDFEEKIGERTKAVIPVDMVGLPCDMDSITRIARENDVKVLEDACQAVGGSYRGKRLGSWGDAGAFSFNQFKIISCGDGGALVTDDKQIYERALIYHDGGAPFRPRYGDLSTPFFIGTNYRMTEIQGAILNVQIKRLDGILEDLREVKKRFIEELPDASLVRSNDPEGDCGVVFAVSFESEEEARRFASSPGVGGWLPIDSGRHVYKFWDPIMAKRGAHHPAMNPYLMPENKECRMDYSDDMCPRTLDYLSRSVFINLHPDWTDEEIEQRIDACRKALS